MTRLAWVAVAVVGGTAWSQEPASSSDVAEAVDEAPPAFTKRVEATGYAANRISYARSRVGGLIPTSDLPQWSELLELNGQIKVTVRPQTFISSDVSLVGQYVGDYRTTDMTGAETTLPAKDVASFRPLVSINELYVLHEFHPALNLLVGKKRLVWGPGLAWNPSDLLNVRRDPTDPTFQRVGVWMARLEMPLERVTLTALFAPSVTVAFNGIPAAFVTYPEWRRTDEQAHFLTALRAYALVADADINAVLFFSNKAPDEFETKWRGALSFSRYFFTDYELHAEALIQSGSTRAYVAGDCVESVMTALLCSANKRAFAERTKLNSAQILPQILVGTRRQFSDESLLSLEYLYQADGLSPSEFQAYVNGFDLLQQAVALGVPLSAITGASLLTGGPTQADGTPARFAFQPTARHYLFASYQKPRIRDDFTVQVTLIANLQDLSTVWTPSVIWSTTEWLSLSLFGFIPLPGPDALGATRGSSGKKVTEYGALPNLARVVFEARLFF